MSSATGSVISTGSVGNGVAGAVGDGAAVWFVSTLSTLSVLVTVGLGVELTINESFMERKLLLKSFESFDDRSSSVVEAVVAAVVADVEDMVFARALNCFCNSPALM